MSVEGLEVDTKYYYCSYVKQNDSYTYGEIKSFTTLPHPYNIQSDLNMSAATDLSSSGSANCYIVSSAGLYKFKTVKGNSNESVGNVASAAILWETFGTSTTPELFDLIQGVCHKDSYIAFQIADTFKEGNAVVAAKDALGAILWSWHIWLTDQPQEHIYNNNAGTMMDRNLGATSATPGDVGALGLFYQWGRMNPFLGSSSISNGTTAKSTITWPSPVKSTSSTGTIEYATSHPTTFISSNSSNWDWYYTGSLSTDNTRWTTPEKDKSIYDPCPAGWRVPDGGANGVWSKAGFGKTTYDSANEGISFIINSPFKTWYPASGFFDGDDGDLEYVGERGLYWSSSDYDRSAFILDFDDRPALFLGQNFYRAIGLSVRCLQESK